MENLTEKLQKIVSDFKAIENPSPEDLSKFKQEEFDLFPEIKTIRELCEYYVADMTIDGMPQPFVSGMYSGTVNGAMFVMKTISDILEEGCNDVVSKIREKLSEIQGLS